MNEQNLWQEHPQPLPQPPLLRSPIYADIDVDELEKIRAQTIIRESRKYHSVLGRASYFNREGQEPTD